MNKKYLFSLLTVGVTLTIIYLIMEKLTIRTPTGSLTVRNDDNGSGDFGASRNAEGGGKREHKGIDLLNEVIGENIVSPIDGKITRVMQVYSNTSEFVGVEIIGRYGIRTPVMIKMFYVDVFPSLVGKDVKRGQIIGVQQDIAGHWGNGMLNHVHLELYINGVLKNPKYYLNLL